MCACSVASSVSLFVTPWTVARQAPLSMGFFRQEYWSGFPCPPPGDLPDPGIKPTSPVSPALQVDALLLNHWGKPENTIKHTGNECKMSTPLNYLMDLGLLVKIMIQG